MHWLTTQSCGPKWYYIKVQPSPNLTSVDVSKHNKRHFRHKSFFSFDWLMSFWEVTQSVLLQSLQITSTTYSLRPTNERQLKFWYHCFYFYCTKIHFSLRAASQYVRCAKNTSCQVFKYFLLIGFGGRPSYFKTQLWGSVQQLPVIV